MNLLLAWAIFTVLVALPFERIESGDVVVQGVALDSPASQAGLQIGDIIDAVNGIAVQHLGELTIEVSRSVERETTLQLIRGSTLVTAILVPRRDPPEGQGAMGVRIGLENIVITTDSIPVWRAPIEGLRTGFSILGFVGDEVGRWINGQSQPEIAGPVGIAQITGEAARMGLVPLIQLIALLSLNLGIINLLPIPALDGGRLPFLLLEALRGGRRLPPKREGMIHLIGFAVLVTFIIVVTIGVDIPRLLSGRGVLPP
jgi:regulator of sigma E protease